MLRKRFGRTELAMPVFSCGGMRYQQAWQDLPADQITRESQDNLEATIRAALSCGINHIETAHGYGCSELQLGMILPTLPRDEMIVQTKVGPGETGDDFERTFDKSMARLKLDHVDLLGVHGINNRELLELTLKPGGSLERALRLREQGRCRHVGFSTHATLDVILDGVDTGLFDYVNLHYYWADPLNAPAVAAAARHDMGVFIISPSEKGGRLFDPPEKLTELCAPLTPLNMSELWALRQPEVHTLSVGAARPSDFDAHLTTLPLLERAEEVLAPVLARLEAEAERVLGRAWLEGWQRGLPTWDQVPGEVNVYHILRLYNLVKAFDMVGYGQFRYNLLGNGGHWFAGQKVPALEGRWDELPAVLADCPVADRVPAALREAHELLDAEERKRLSQGG